MTTKWRFHDTKGLVPDYVWEINPGNNSTGGDMLPNFVKNILYTVNLQPDQMPLIYEGRDNLLEMSASGTFVTQDQYLNFVVWFGLTRPFLLTDDLGNQFTIYPTQYQPTRKRSRSFAWRGDYTFKWLVLGATYAS